MRISHRWIFSIHSKLNFYLSFIISRYQNEVIINKWLSFKCFLFYVYLDKTNWIEETFYLIKKRYEKCCMFEMTRLIIFLTDMTLSFTLSFVLTLMVISTQIMAYGTHRKISKLNHKSHRETSTPLYSPDDGKLFLLLLIFRSTKTLFYCVPKSEYSTKIGQCVQQSVYSITLHNYIRLSWNFVHRIVSSISRSSSKMRRIRQKMAELSKKLSSSIRPSLRGDTGIFFKKNIFLKIIQNINKSTQFLTLIPNLILVLNQIVSF